MARRQKTAATASDGMDLPGFLRRPPPTPADLEKLRRPTGGQDRRVLFGEPARGERFDFHKPKGLTWEEWDAWCARVEKEKEARRAARAPKPSDDGEEPRRRLARSGWTPRSLATLMTAAGAPGAARVRRRDVAAALAAAGWAPMRRYAAERLAEGRAAVEKWLAGGASAAPPARRASSRSGSGGSADKPGRAKRVRP